LVKTDVFFWNSTDMILTELRGYGIAEKGISVNSTNKPNTSLKKA